MGGPPGGQARGQGGQAMGGPPGGGQAMGAPPGGQQGGGGPQGAFGQAVSVRFITKDDWLSVPNSYVYFNQADSALIGVKRFGQNSFGQKLFGMLNPLHTGNNISPIYAMVMALMATLAAIMIFSGVVSMFWNLLKKKREAGSIVILSKGEGDKSANVTIEVPGTSIEGAPAE